MAIPLLEAIDIKGKDITADALLTQRKFAGIWFEKRQAHYSFTVKGTSSDCSRTWNSTSGTGANRTSSSRRLPITAASRPANLDDHRTQRLSRLPARGPAFLIERHVIEKKTGSYSLEIAYRPHQPHSPRSPPPTRPPG